MRSRCDPTTRIAHNNLGQSLLALAKGDEAEHHFREAARLDPANANAHYNIALIARARGDLAETRSRLARAVELQPDWVPAVASLAWLLATSPVDAMRDADMANVLAEHATELTSRRNATVLDVLAAAQAAAGNFEAAVLTGEEALRLAPDASVLEALRQRVALYGQRQPFVFAARDR